MFNPHNINPEELWLVEDKIRATEVEIKNIEERKAACSDPERLKELDDYIRIKKVDLARFKQECQYILGRGFEDLE